MKSFPRSLGAELGFRCKGLASEGTAGIAIECCYTPIPGSTNALSHPSRFPSCLIFAEQQSLTSNSQASPLYQRRPTRIIESSTRKSTPKTGARATGSPPRGSCLRSRDFSQVSSLSDAVRVRGRYKDLLHYCRASELLLRWPTNE